MTERFVGAIVLGGVALVAGLWVVELLSGAVQLAGVGLVGVGVIGLAWGIYSELEV